MTTLYVLRKNMKKLILLLLFSSLANFLAASPKWNEAYEAYRSKDWEEAIELFKKIKEEEKEYATAQRYIGYNIYGRELNDWSKAIEHCINAYQKDPNDEKVLEDLGRACLKKQKELE